MKVLLLKKNKKEIGRITPDRRSLLIGRSPVCDMVIRNDDQIKPLHFLLEWTGEGHFDPNSGFWTVIEITNSDIQVKKSTPIPEAFHGEAQVLISDEINFAGYQFEIIEEKLAKTSISRGVITRSLDYDNDDKTFVSNESDSVMELVTYSRSNDLVTSINHFSKDILAKGIKISSLAKLNFIFDQQKPNILSIENLGESNLVDIYNRSERLINEFSQENAVCNIDIEDFYLLYSPDNAYYFRWVPKVTSTPPPMAWKKDPVILTLIFVTIAMFVIGLVFRSIERPKSPDIPKPARIATVEIVETPTEEKFKEPELPIIDKEVKTEEVKAPPIEIDKEQLKQNKNSDKSQVNQTNKIKNETEAKSNVKVAKEQGKRATVKNVEENNDLSQGLNQKGEIKNVNSVGLLGKLAGGKKLGKGVSAQAVLSKVTPVDSASGTEGKPLVSKPPTGEVSLTGGNTEASNQDGKGLAAASTTLKMDNVSKGANISGMASSKATGSVGSGAFGGNTKEGSDSIQSLGGSVSIEVKSMEVQGGLTKEQVRQAISDNKRALRNCHEQYLTYKKDLGGRLVLKWKISGEGPVDTVSVQSSNTNYGTFDTCVLDVIKKIVFPKAPNGNSTVVIYPFVFQPKK
ncbi:MAG: AgmX/PglI C-terminal domain-containing protein [Bdellovibrionaceae bacterium]|nr:AgmX/PglI C-terminal domain-containing protein [Pseudobdellovibrionaceae bacterium]NUM57069.1 energy transducer TonB [Pseudobdellovibrionaceae bacterium]